MTARVRVMVVDDEEGIRFALKSFLEAKGYAVTLADSCGEAEKLFRTTPVDLVVLDFGLPDGDGVELLTRLRAVDGFVPVVMLTAHGSIELAVRAIQKGMDQFLVKPVDLASLGAVLEKVLEDHRARRRQMAREGGKLRELNPFLGVSSSIHALETECRRAVEAEGGVLLLGETGTGKSELARWIHRHGPRAAEPLVELNCAGFRPEFLESELFGYEKGAFTGAVGSKPGLLEVANRGSVFLDELGDMDAAIQPKLLKALEERRFRRLGGLEDRTVDVRLIAATHQDLEGLVREKRFRADLYYRVSTLPIRVPALRERADDIPLLALHLLESLAEDLRKPVREISEAALERLRGHSWPGNIRELRNVLERGLLACTGSRMEAADLAFGGQSAAGPDSTLGMSLEALERFHIERVLQAEGGKVDAAAKRLGIPRSTLYQKLKTYGFSSRF
ncbi:MAG TPA: sigma-54 dependent transcriptional regulator [Holophagaceae bacterium]|jgi:DNA-binding NtrC family response regulator|nr:sigma-54 dependent transcriptional regulator [Holophagaceae bacterium]